MDFLSEIVEEKRERVQTARNETPIDEMLVHAIDARLQTKLHRLHEVLANEAGVNIIAEIKRASTSRGVIREGADVAALARAYLDGGAVAISVLTEEKY